MPFHAAHAVAVALRASLSTGKDARSALLPKALPRRLGDPAQGLDVARDAQGGSFLGAAVVHAPPRVHHLALECLAHPLVIPAELLKVLDPLEIGDGDAAVVGQDVRDDRDAATAKNLLGLGCDRRVCGLDDQLGRDLIRVRSGDRPPNAAWIRSSTSSIRSSALSMSRAPFMPTTLPVLDTCSHVLGISNPCSAQMPPVTSDTATTLAPGSAIRRAVHETTFPKPWIASRGLIEPCFQGFARLARNDAHASPGRLLASEGATQVYRLAGDDGRGVAVLLPAFVHDPQP